MDPTDWLPTYTDLLPPRRRVLGPALASAPPYNTEIFPVPDIGAGLTFLASYPDRIPHVPLRALWLPATAPVFTAAIAPTCWQPCYPAQVPHRRLATAAQPYLFAPSASVGALVAQWQAWRATFPDHVSHQQVPRLAGSFWTVPPQTAAIAVGCGAHLLSVALTTPQLTTEQGVQSTTTQDHGTTTDLIDEGIC